MDEQYYRQQIKVVDERLALAGLRLAAVLNEVRARVAAGVPPLKPGENTTCLEMDVLSESRVGRQRVG